jgi:hypothetical protein
MKRFLVGATALFFAAMSACQEIPQDVKAWEPDQVKYILTNDHVRVWQKVARTEDGEAVDLENCLDQWRLDLADTMLNTKGAEVLTFTIQACETPSDTLLWSGTWKVMQSHKLESADTLVFYGVNGSLKDTLTYRIEEMRTEYLRLFTQEIEEEDTIEVIEEYEKLITD